MQGGNLNTRPKRLEDLAVGAGCLALGFVFGHLVKEINYKERMRQEYELKLQKMQELKDHFQREASIDGLTGIHNRAYFETQLREELERARRLGGEFALVFLDLKNFKQINDVHGHLMGDQVLRFIAQVLRSSFRQMDVLARYGGDEFVVLMPGASKSEAYKAGKRADQEVAASTERVFGSKVQVRRGIASYPRDAQDSATLLRVADTAMYRAKAAENGKVLSFPREGEATSL